jgi:hypothetical protein
MMLPKEELAAGESYVIALCFDAAPQTFKLNIPKFWAEKVTRDSIWSIADLQIHVYEIDEATQQYYGIKDSVSAEGTFLQGIWSGGSCVYLRQHRPEVGDSIVIDQFGGVFDDPNGRNYPHPYDIAGVTDATANSVAIRKYSVKQGNLNFAEARGVGEDDSEWIIVPYIPQGFFRDVYWTLGNHGNYQLDENTLESDVAQVDFNNLTITVPWGTRRCDDVMHLMKYKPGLAWDYILSPNYEDSLSCGAHTGDKIEIIACGDKGFRATFDIIVSDPTADDNIVIPAISPDPYGHWRGWFDEGIIPWPRVTRHESGQDTIWGIRGGIPYDTRVDSLFKRLDKPEKASWEIVWVDGVEKRANIKEGDLLRVTSESGKVKDYYIKVLPPLPSHDATLSAITWPDIPEDYKDMFGWKGDTIPGFSPEVYNYRILVPFDYDGIPAFTCQTHDPNAKVSVKRATSLAGDAAQRTVIFGVVAEDDTSAVSYNIELVKEKDPASIQPFAADPFISERYEYEQWANSYMEIVNPGNQPLDLGQYMIVSSWSATSPADVITYTRPWKHRFEKYIPGYKWAPTESEWDSNPDIAIRDNNVSPYVEGGDVFVMGSPGSFGELGSDKNAEFYKEVILSQVDLIMTNVDKEGQFLSVSNPWGEEVGSTAAIMWKQGGFYLFKILNDSVTRGLKPANDPADFKLIDVYGMADGGERMVCMDADGNRIAWGYNVDYRRNPDIYKGNPVYEGSFAHEPNSCGEWDKHTPDEYASYGYPGRMTMLGSDLGKHFMNPATYYLSTVSSTVYIVSDGYSDSETIKGVVTGTKVTGFLANIIKADEGQTLTLKSSADGSELTGDDVLNDQDSLIVLSADSSNVTKYLLNVTDEGLSKNAILTSDVYTITINGKTGAVAGMEYSTTLNDVLSNVVLPEGARLDVIDGKGAYVPTKKLNYDTLYVDVTVNTDIYLEVTAEDNTTRITYQLTPNSSSDDAFVLSYVYEVVQDGYLIKYVPRGTNVQALLGNLIPAAGASMKVVDKFGLERNDGDVADDDRVIVTSASGNVSTVYFISMLATKYIPEGSYLAYILSDIYDVDQLNYNVAKVPDGETVANFLANITPAPGATVVIVDVDGLIKTSGNVLPTDKVRVTAPNGKTVVCYTIGAATGVGNLKDSNITLYPNPTSGILNISGLEPGYRLRIFSMNGSIISDIMVNGTLNTISLANEPTGIYLIEVLDGKTLVGHFKVLKK